MDEKKSHAHCVLDTLSYKHTLRMCNNYDFPLQQWFHQHALLLRYSILSVLLNVTRNLKYR